MGASLLAMASAQSCRYSRLSASLASQLPQGCMGLWEPACWRWFRLNPADTAGCLHRWQASSHKGVWALWEPACWRWLRFNPADTVGCLHRWQASSHKGVWVLWEPACWRWFRLNPADTAGCLHRWQASPLKFVSQVGLCRALYGFAYGQIPHQQPVVQVHLLRNRQVYGVAVTRCHLNRQPGAVV